MIVFCFFHSCQPVVVWSCLLPSSSFPFPFPQCWQVSRASAALFDPRYAPDDEGRKEENRREEEKDESGQRWDAPPLPSCLFFLTLFHHHFCSIFRSWSPSGRYSYHRTAFIAQYCFYKSMIICFMQVDDDDDEEEEEGYGNYRSTASVVAASMRAGDH